MEISQHSDDSSMQDHFSASHLEKYYDEILDEMNSFKATFSSKIEAYKARRQKVLADIEALNSLRKQKEAFIAGLEKREQTLAQER